jgi:hypothetical protein
MTRTTPCRRMMRQFSHSLLMDGLTFMEDEEKRDDDATRDMGNA